jgi:translocation and assembly module TamB
MRVVAKLVLLALLMLVSAIVVVTWVLQRPAVRARLTSVLSETLTSGNDVVSLSGLGGFLPFAPTLEKVELADAAGVWLRVESVSVEVDPLALLRRRVHVRNATAQSVAVLRAPQGDDEPFELAPTRLTVRVDRLHVSRIELGRGLLGDESASGLATPIEIEAHGKVDLRRLTLAVEAIATTTKLDDLLASIGLKSTAARATLALHGAIAAPGGVVTLSAGNVAWNEVTASGIDLRADFERLGHGSRRYAVRVGARTSDLVLPPAYAGYVGSAPSLHAEVHFGETPGVFDVEDLRLEGATFALQMAAESVGENALRVTRALATVPDLAALSDFAPYVETGVARLTATGDLTFRPGDVAARARLDVTTSDVTFVDSALAAVVGSDPSTSVDVGWREGGALTLDDASVALAAFRAAGHANLAPDGQLTSRWSATAADLTAFSELAGRPVSGMAEADVEVAGTWQQPDVAATLRASGVRVADFPTLQGEIALRARRDGATTAGSTAARLRVDDEAVRWDGDLSYDESTRSLEWSRLEIVVPGAVAAARGEIDVTTGLLKGAATLTVEDLTPVAAMLSVPAAGQLRLDVELDHDGGVQGGHLRATSTSLGLQDLEVADLDLEATRSPRSGETTFQVAADGQYGRDVALRARGRLHGDLQTGHVEIDALDARYGRFPIGSRGVIRLSHAQATVASLEGVIEVAGGRVDAVWQGDLRRGVGRIGITDLPLELLELVADEAKLVGTVSGQMMRSRADAGVDVALRTARAAVASAAAPAGIARFDLDMSGSIGARRSVARLVFGSVDDQSRFELQADAPVGLDGVDASQSLDARLTGVVSADLVGHLMLPPEDRLGGEVNVDLRLGGPWQTPRLDGGMAGRLRYVNAATGMHLRVDELAVRAAGQRVQVTALRGGDGRDGRFEGNGEADFAAGWALPSYVLNVAYKDMYLARVDELVLRGDGNVALSGRGSELALRGDFSAKHAVIRVPSRLPPDIASLPVEHVNREYARWTPSREGGSTAAPIALDLRIGFPSRLRVEDPNLDSEWRGELFVRGTTQNLRVEGALAVTRGAISLGGVRFRTREGRLSFDEGGDVPVIDVTAVATRNEIEATLRLSGRINRLAFALTSEPPLPQDEILSRLMFGSATTTLTAGQAIQLAQAAARLSGHGGGVDVLSRVRRLTGVDRIEIRETEGAAGPETSVSVGKYVHDRIYVSVDQPVAGEGSKARVEVEVSKHITAETEVGQDETARFGVNWRLNY